MSFEPRAYQTQAVQAVVTAFQQGKRQLLLRLPTGSGKTVISALLLEEMLAKIPGRRVLFLAHRKEIIDQTAEKIAQQIGADSVAIEQAERRASRTARVIVASVQTLAARLDDYRPDDFGMLIVDECHHAFAKTWMDTISHFGKRADTLLLGLTATPKRSDGRCISELFSETVFELSLGELQEQGYLVPMDYYTIEASLGLGSLSLDQTGDFQSTQLGKMMNTTELRGLILRAWHEKARNKKTIVFCASLNHAEQLAADFVQIGINAASISGQSPNRDAIIRDFRLGKISVLSNYGVLTEGFDDPSITCVLLARPTTSPLVYSQCLGRGLRIYPGKLACTVIDIIDRQAHQLQYNAFEAAGLARSFRGTGHDPLREAQAIARIRVTDPGAFLKIRNALSLDETHKILMGLDPQTVIAGIDGMPLVRYEPLEKNARLSPEQAKSVAQLILQESSLAPINLDWQEQTLLAILYQDEESKLSSYLVWHIKRSTGYAIKFNFLVRPPIEEPQEFMLELAAQSEVVAAEPRVAVTPAAPLSMAKEALDRGLKARLEKIFKDSQPSSQAISGQDLPPQAAPVKERNPGLSIQDKLKAIKADFAQRHR